MFYFRQAMHLYETRYQLNDLRSLVNETFINNIIDSILNNSVSDLNVISCWKLGCV